MICQIIQIDKFMMKLKPLIREQEEQPPQAAAQGNFYDWTHDFDTFKSTVNSATESAKTKFEKSLGSKVLNKSVMVRASKGYKQPVKDYTLNRVSAVNANDYYEDWVVVLKNETNKEFFLTPGYKVKVLGAAVAAEPGAANAPEQEPPAPPTPEPKPAVPAGPAAVKPPQGQPSQPLKESEDAKDLKDDEYFVISDFEPVSSQYGGPYRVEIKLKSVDSDNLDAQEKEAETYLNKTYPKGQPFKVPAFKGFYDWKGGQTVIPNSNWKVGGGYQHNPHGWGRRGSAFITAKVDVDLANKPQQLQSK